MCYMLLLPHPISERGNYSSQGRATGIEVLVRQTALPIATSERWVRI